MGKDQPDSSLVQTAAKGVRDLSVMRVSYRMSVAFLFIALSPTVIGVCLTNDLK